MKTDCPVSPQSISSLSIQCLERKTRRLRATCVQMAHDGGEGHLNGALSCMDLLVALFYRWMKNYPDNPKHENRDRFIFSKGHACTAYYAILADRGFIPMNWLAQYAKNNSPLPSHPCLHALPVLDWSSGSLGHGLGVATGMSYGLKLSGNPSRVVTLLSDGECNEGSTWEGAMFAAAQQLENLLVVVDYNRIQSVGRTDVLNGFTSFEEKFKAFGWGAKTIDGHHLPEINDALNEFPFESGKPSALIAKTTAGRGVSFMEDQVLWHYRVPSGDDVKQALEELGEAPLYFREGNPS
ncbi:MAG: transketolase [Nitrospirota bacterium]|nr:transketolase [Nitrospirota bacterium]